MPVLPIKVGGINDGGLFEMETPTEISPLFHVQDPFYNDLNKVFIPYRSIIEMEALSGLVFGTRMFDEFKEVPKTRPSSAQLIKLLGVKDNPAQERIVKYFEESISNKLKPVVLYEREHHNIIRMGNVIPYAEGRVPVFFSLHLLKLKFLHIKRFFDNFWEKFITMGAVSAEEVDRRTLLANLGMYYYNESRSCYGFLLPRTGFKQGTDASGITNEKILQMVMYLFVDEEQNKIKYIMRAIKASLFVTKLLFSKLDVDQPFAGRGTGILDPEDTMVSNDFIPELLPAISRRISEHKIGVAEGLYNAVKIMMNTVLDGINHAIVIASGGQIKLARDAPLFHTHPS